MRGEGPACGDLRMKTRTRAVQDCCCHQHQTHQHSSDLHLGTRCQTLMNFIHSFVHPFMHSFMHSLIREIANSLPRSLARCIARSLARSLARSFIHSIPSHPIPSHPVPFHEFARSLIHLIAHSDSRRYQDLMMIVKRLSDVSGVAFDMCC